MENPQPERKKHRLPSDCYATAAHVAFITVCCVPGKSPFHDARLAEISLLWTRTHHNWLLFCYCVMPDHIHFVCRWKSPTGTIMNRGALGKSGETLLDHIARFKSFTTRESWRLGWTGPLWQHNSYDEMLDSSGAAAQKIQYTLDNPKRAGLVENSADWPFAAVVDVFDGLM